MSAVIYRCPNCGAPLSLDPNTEKLHCEYCLTDTTIDEQAQKEAQKPNESDNKKSDTDEDMRVYNCPSCGATVVTTSTTSSTFCYYCHSPVVLSSRLDGEYKPTQIIPFAIDEKSARDIFLKWCKSKKFAPSDFTSEKHIEKMTGIYFPYWLVDNDVNFDYASKSTKVNIAVIGDTETTETLFYEHIRKGNATLVDVPAVALKSANEDILNSLYPYDNKDIKPFNMSYLSGFFAEAFDKTKQDVTPAINSLVDDYTNDLVTNTLPHGTNTTSKNLQSDILSQNWDFTLLPTWILTYKYKDKIYMFGINAQTGKVCGEVPVDKVKLALFTTAVAVGTFGILGSIGGFLLG